MALIKDDLKIKMIDAASGGEDKNEIFDKIGTAVQDYVIENTEILFSWIALGPPPASAPDPMVVAKGGFDMLEIKFDTFKASEFETGDDAFNVIAQDLILSFTTATYNVTDAGFSTAPQVFGSSPNIANLQLAPEGGNKDAAFGIWADKIITYIKSQVLTVPCAGSHGAFTGTATVTTIS